MRHKAFKIAIDKKYNRYQRGLASIVYKLFDTTISWQISFLNQLLKKFKKEKFINHLKTIFGVLI